MLWLVMAVLSAIFAGLTAVLAALTSILAFIVFSGLATGASWLCYYYAIQNGIVSVVVPIDKMSILVSVVFSYIVFQEKLSKKSTVGLLLMVCGTLTIAICG